MLIPTLGQRQGVAEKSPTLTGSAIKSLWLLLIHSNGLSGSWSMLDYT